MAPRRTEAELAERAFSPLGVIAPPPIHVQTPVFEGTLAVLFKCVRDQNVDLLGIPLFPICEAYFAYMIAANLDDIDEAAAALAALAYLLERKAWLLLPVIEPEPEYEEPMEALEPTSYEFSTVIEALETWQEARSKMFFRSAEASPDPYELPFSLANVTSGDLAKAFERLLKRATPERFESLARPKRSLEEQMKAVLLAVGSEWRTLDSLVPDPFTKEEAVYWFLALLELVRLGKIQARVYEENVEFSSK